MRETDVAIVGGGCAGSAAAAMLGRAGIDAVLIDPHEHYPPDFRCEKLDTSQLDLLKRTGVGDSVFRMLTPGEEVWVARFGRLLRRRRHAQAGFAYETLVEAFRAEMPESVAKVQATVLEIETSDDRQELRLSDGSRISARLVVMATGLNNGLRKSLGITRHELSPSHSVSIGFDVERRSGAFGFSSLTYSPERHTDQTSYLTLFRLGPTMRANLFVYRDPKDPWLRDMKQSPERTLKRLMPRLARLIGDFEVTGKVHVRPVDLCVTEGYRRAGVVLVGDAFSTSCPAAGTGLNKVLTDVVQLCSAHVPRWLATPGMGAEKISAFYDDQVKHEADRHSREKAFFLRDLSTGGSLRWRMQRLARGAAQLVFALKEAFEAHLPPPSAAEDHASGGRGGILGRG